MAECVRETSLDTEGIPGSERGKMVDDHRGSDILMYLSFKFVVI